LKRFEEMKEKYCKTHSVVTIFCFNPSFMIFTASVNPLHIASLTVLLPFNPIKILIHLVERHTNMLNDLPQGFKHHLIKGSNPKLNKTSRIVKGISDSHKAGEKWEHWEDESKNEPLEILQFSIKCSLNLTF